MQQEDCSTLWDLQQKMIDGRMWSVCNVGPQVCSVEQTEDAAVTQYHFAQTTLLFQISNTKKEDFDWYYYKFHVIEQYIQFVYYLPLDSAVH